MTDTPAAKSRATLYDVELPVTVIIGRTELSLKALSEWAPDSIVALTSRADQPIELCVNGKVVATGELCDGEAGDGSLAVRILDIKEDPTDA